MVDKLQTPHYEVQRRVQGEFNYRLDGLTDLLTRARRASVFDIGCNRGAAGYDFALNGAKKVHGCDNYEQGILAAREWFADLRRVESQFEVVDLTRGQPALKRFAGHDYDIVLCLATYHKLKRAMEPGALSELMRYFARLTKGYFGWRGTSQQHDQNDAEIVALDKDLGAEGLARIHTSYISAELGVAAIWARC